MENVIELIHDVVSFHSIIAYSLIRYWDFSMYLSHIFLYFISVIYF